VPEETPEEPIRMAPGSASGSNESHTGNSKRAEEAKGQPRKDEINGGAATLLSKPWWLGIGAIAAVLALAGAVAAVLPLVSNDNHTTQAVPLSPILSEEKMVNHLVPGDDYTKLKEIIGANPDNQQELESGSTLYQFDRPWEYIDLLVKKSQVISIGIFARSTKFRASIDASGDPITVNGPSIAQQAQPSSLASAIGLCSGGDSPVWFFEAFSLPMTNLATSFALGWVQGPPGYLGTPTGARTATVPVPYTACIAANQCYKVATLYSLSSKFFGCLNSVEAGRRTGNLSPSAIVVTAPYGNITPDMVTVVPAPFSG
jgi:hypothetical protein